MGYPAPVGRRTLRRVARAAQHRGVGDVERRTASGERDDVIDGQVGGPVGGAPVARAPVAMLATPGAQHAGAESLPGPRAVEGVVPAAVGLPGVLGTAATRAAGDDTADRAQLHPRIVGGVAGAVYSPAVLRVEGQAQGSLRVTNRCHRAIISPARVDEATRARAERDHISVARPPIGPRCRPRRPPAPVPCATMRRVPPWRLRWPRPTTSTPVSAGRRSIPERSRWRCQS